MTKDQFIKELKKKVKSLKIPAEYWGINLDEFFQFQWNIYLSVRQVAGKTTQSLILALCAASICPEHYGTFAYLRNDVSQITRSHIETLFNTVVRFGYISKIYGGRWNDVVYKSQQRKFYLCLRDADGSIIDEDKQPVCSVHAVEKWQDDKSSVNLPNCGLIILDEFPDTNRATYRLFTELLNEISTIGRPLSDDRRDWLHILLLGNNTSEYCWLFDDIEGLAEDIPYLSFGGRIVFNTEYNTNGVCRLLELGEPQKKRLADRNIPFLGFTGKKAAPFTGSEAWGGKSYRHPDFDLNYEYCHFRRCYVFHRGRYIQFDLFADDERGKYAFAHFANKPQLEDNVVFTLEPASRQDVYAFGKYEKNQNILKLCKLIVSLIQENRIYYASNRVGSLIDDYIKNIV